MPNWLFHIYSLDSAKMIMIAQRVSIVSILLVDTVFARNVKIVIITIEKEMVDPVPKGGLWSF